MSVLLDYFFPITAIEPTPAANTGFLRQVLAVVKPKDGVAPGTVTQITSTAQIAALTDNEDVVQLFNAGLSRVYVLVTEDLDLAEIVNARINDFFTILISSDFSQEEIESVGAVAPVKSSLKLQDILYTAKTAGLAGNGISVEYVDGGTAGAESVLVTGQAIQVTIESGASTAAQIVTALQASTEAMALVDVLVDTGDEADSQTAQAETDLAGGTDTVPGDDTGLDVGTFAGVVAVSSSDNDFLASQAVIKNRVAFKTAGTTKAKNMFFAFGKLLSNSLSWLNQQYITMPFSDGINLLGDAQALFDDKISFVLSDSQFGNRLSLLAVGGKAIVAPYIVKNLEIDMQSAGLQYISGNMPDYTPKQAALLEESLQRVIDSYIDRQFIGAGEVEVKLEQDNFIASGYIDIAEPKALWRVFGQMKQTL